MVLIFSGFIAFIFIIDEFDLKKSKNRDLKLAVGLISGCVFGILSDWGFLGIVFSIGLFLFLALVGMRLLRYLS